MVAEPVSSQNDRRDSTVEEWEPVCRDEFWEAHRELTEQIQRDVRRNARSPYTGRWIGLLGGQVAAVAETFDALAKRMTALEPNPQRRAFFLAGADYDVVHTVYGE